MSFYTKPDSRMRNKIKFELDLSNYSINPGAKKQQVLIYQKLLRRLI